MWGWESKIVVLVFYMADPSMSMTGLCQLSKSASNLMSESISQYVRLITAKTMSGLRCDELLQITKHPLSYEEEQS